MICKYPVVMGGTAFSCGQCLPCRIGRRRVWMHRILLEALQYENNSFVTLTYGDDFLPDGGSLVPRDLQLFIKRLRKEVAPEKIRFFAVGEYGDKLSRPHYHLALFNYKSCWRGMSHYRKGVVNCCDQCDRLRDTWASGNVYLGELNSRSAQYVCGYVVKKMTSATDFRLEGRHPEFVRMSRRPGIGVSAMHEVASELLRYDLVEAIGDVPEGLRHGAAVLPLGRFLKRKLRLLCGYEQNAPPEKVEEARAELQQLYSLARDRKAEGSIFPLEYLFKEELHKEWSQKLMQVEARERIYRKKDGLR